MIPFLLRRAAVGALLLTAASLLIFIVLRLLPGDPITSRLSSGTGVTQEQVQELVEEAGLADPLPVQYWRWVSGVASGDLGRSYFSDYSVSELIAQRLPLTFELTLLAIAVGMVGAVPAAVLAARRPGGVVDRVTGFLSSASIAAPQFVIAIVLILVFGNWLGVLPTRGYRPFSVSPAENLRYMVLPALTLAAAGAPMLFRVLRTALIETLQSPYVRTAMGKGVPPRRLLLGHALRNAAPSGITMVGLLVGYALGGAVIVEFVFGLPGLGTLAINSVERRDYAVLQSLVLLVAAMFILTNLIVDVVVGFVDPRYRVENRSVG